MKTALILLAAALGVFGDVTAENPELVETVAGAEHKKDAKPGLTMIDIRHNVLWMKRHTCNGALIDAEWILLPAYCVKKKPSVGKFMVEVGNRKIGIKKIILHEKANSIQNDVALVRLSSPVTGFPFVNLPVNGTNFSNPLTVYTRDGKGKIQTFDVNEKALSECPGVPSPLGLGHICAGDSQTRSLKGQEGSLLIKSHPTEGNIVVGLLSFARKQKGPSVYTRVSSYTPWIVDKMIRG